MSSNLKFGSPSQTRMVLLETSITPQRFVLSERREKSRSRRNAEALTGGLIALLFVCAYLQLFLPQIFPAAFGVSAPLMLSGSAVAAGLGLYAWMTRGYLPEFGIDREKREVWTCMLNSQGRARVRQHFATSDVRSIYVFRPEGQTADAALCLKVRANPRPIYLVRGQMDEIKAAHDQICRFLRADQAITPATPRFASAAAKPRTAPSVFASPRRS
ncbi:hypothetical protein [Roseobacter ponti]|uniref:Integral membrane protein n=1 Tax=Roseobacter ponti TaxID=1891787 RepID=A0A858SWG9_9RHOB|nr:hypothetical protein [Roseobacter ponti]QJF53329.1 hypothetical protein G3256_18760 [Roseobacter ponti]